MMAARQRQLKRCDASIPSFFLYEIISTPPAKLTLVFLSLDESGLLGPFGRWPHRGITMAFEIDFTKTAAEHIRGFRNFEQRDHSLIPSKNSCVHEPTTETRNRKRLGENELSDWELRVQQFRVFYDVDIDEQKKQVKVKAVGWKDHNILRIGGRETQL